MLAKGDGLDTRREEIVLAAADLAAERGLSAVTVRAVAARAGIGASTLRHYFPTQSELYHAMVGTLDWGAGAYAAAGKEVPATARASRASGAPDRFVTYVWLTGDDFDQAHAAEAQQGWKGALLLPRARLMASNPWVRDAPVVLLQAPGGFGKTSLLAQWRLEHLAQGAVVAWLSAQQRDDPQRLVQGMALAVRIGAGRPSFGHTVIEGADMSELEAVTRWLAELSQLALRWILMFEAVTTAIPGARTPEQARMNAAAADLPDLDAATMTAVREIYDRRIRRHIHDAW